MKTEKSNPAGKRLPPTPWGLMPPELRVLFVGGSSPVGTWLEEAFRSDSACSVTMELTQGIAAGVARLRDEAYDAVLVSHEPDSLDALELLDAIRTGSSDEQPILVLGTGSEREMADLCFESGADAYLCVDNTTTRTLLWQVARARERHQLISENRRMRQAQRHRLQLEHDEATRLLQQQRALIAGLETIPRTLPISQLASQSLVSGSIQDPCPSAAAIENSDAENLPTSLGGRYRELLRAYVIMGSGNMADEMTRLTEQLAFSNVSSAQLMMLHLHVLEDVVSSLGNRSARHVLNRADLLILEIMMNLAERYRANGVEYAPRTSERTPGSATLRTAG